MAERLVRIVISVALVMDEILHISRSEVTGQTLLLILDFRSGELIVVIESGVVKELLVEDRLEEELEVGHEAGIVTVLVLLEDGDEAVVFFVLNVLGGGDLGECESGLDSTHESNGVESTSDTHL